MNDRRVPALRPARAGDTGGLAEIDRDNVDVLRDPVRHDELAEDPDVVLLVAGSGTGIAGYLVLAAPRGTEPGVELRRLVVAAEHRGAGLGRALLDTALRLAAVPDAPRPGLGVDPVWSPPHWLAAGRIWLEVAPDNTAALELYTTAGMVTETGLAPAPGADTATPLRLILARE